MSDYLISALGYLTGTPGNHEYVGQLIEINNVKLRITRLIAEGGWALVFAVEDVATGKEYALKRLIAVDEEANKSIVQEIEILKKLTGHQNVIQYLCAQRVDREDKRTCEYLLVTELCTGGNLADLLRSLGTPLSPQQICKVAYQATKAVHHMHSQQPQPIIHWDIKLENFLIATDGIIKLCDFGSASTQQILPDPSWNASKRAALEDQMSKYTTPMYRPPEMMDTWNNEPIGPPADCWALGCILYALVTLRHPFPEGNKLAIVNARYNALSPNPKLSCFHELIKGLLEASPIKRMTTSTLLERLAAIAESNNFDPRESAKIEVPPAVKSVPNRPSPPAGGPAPAQPPPRPSPPATSVAASVAGSGSGPAIPPRPSPPSYPPKPAPPLHAGSSGSSGLFSSLKGGAGSILKNLKDTSSKVMHTVQQSMARTELDASYLTSRILVMPYPADGIESAYRANHIEDVRAYLQSRHPPPAKIQLYNLSRGRPNVARLPGKHIDCTFAYATAESTAPLLSALYQICQDIYRYLDADFNHIVVLYCSDGCRASATVACALLLYSNVLTTPEETLTFFTTRRCQPPILQPSELRSIHYMSLLQSGIHPHTKPLALRSVILQPVPLFTRAKDGCRPYAEIYSNGALVYSTKRPEYEEMKLFDMMEGKACLILGDATVRGDVTLLIFHARQQLGRVIGIKIASLHFHTGYVPITESSMNFEKKDLDDTPEIGGKFKIVLNVMIGEENTRSSRIPAPWEVEASRDEDLHPDPLFGSTLEMEETLESFRTNGGPEKRGKGAGPQPPPRPQPPVTLQPEEEPLNEGESPLDQEEAVDDGKKGEEFLEADLLNLGSSLGANTQQNALQNANSVKSTNPSGLDIFSSNQGDADIFGGFSSFQGKNGDEKEEKRDFLFGDNSSNDLIFGEGNKPQSSPNNLIFDPLGTNSNANANVNANANNLMGNWGNSKNSLKTPGDESFPRNSSVPNFAAQNKDPFANLAGSLGAGLNSSWNGTPRESNTPQSNSPAAAGTPVHSSPRMQNKTNNEGNDVFGTKPAKSGDAFEDLLGSQGYNFFSSRKGDKDSPKTINQMRKVEQAKTMDPDRLKICEWTEGKKGNLRALLCSLHTVLWPEADRWQRYEMHQLVTPADVKKAYRKACLAVHPDKQAGTANENIAKLIFMELNNAWSAFESDASQQNLFS